MAMRTALANPEQPKRAVAKKKTGEVITASYAVDDIPTAEQVGQALATGSKLYFDGDETTGSILPGILANAESPIDLFDEGTLEAVENHLGETLNILSVDGVRNSDFEGGLGVYLIVTANTIDGEILRLSVGVVDGVAKLSAIHHMGGFPWAVSFERSTKATKSGFYPINMKSRQPRSARDLDPGMKPFD